MCAFFIVVTSDASRADNNQHDNIRPTKMVLAPNIFRYSLFYVKNQDTFCGKYHCNLRSIHQNMKITIKVDSPYIERGIFLNFDAPH